MSRKPFHGSKASQANGGKFTLTEIVCYSAISALVTSIVSIPASFDWGYSKCEKKYRGEVRQIKNKLKDIKAKRRRKSDE